MKGVSIADVRAAVAKRLKEPRPKPISEAQWRHAVKLYAEYGGYPIWLDGDGLRERRTKTLMTALLNAGPFTLAPWPQTGPQRDRDRYGRLLRVVTRDGESLGATLVREGLAEAWQGRRGSWC